MAIAKRGIVLERITCSFYIDHSSSRELNRFPDIQSALNDCALSYFLTGPLHFQEHYKAVSCNDV
jgi:hypothetical protein